MAVTIRLTRRGAKKKPFYRLVAADSRFPRDGRFIEVLGTYDPKGDPAGVHLDREKIQSWVDRGGRAFADREKPSQEERDFHPTGEEIGCCRAGGTGRVRPNLLNRNSAVEIVCSTPSARARTGHRIF